MKTKLTKAEKIIAELKKKRKVHSIKLIGNKKNKADGFYIMILNQPITSTEKNIFHGVSENTIKLLKEAEIKFEVLK